MSSSDVSIGEDLENDRPDKHTLHQDKKEQANNSISSSSGTLVSQG